MDNNKTRNMCFSEAQREKGNLFKRKKYNEKNPGMTEKITNIRLGERSTNPVRT